MFLKHRGSSSKVNCKSVKLQCKRYARMRSNFKKVKVQISQVHTQAGTYRYIPVRTGIDINHTRTLHFDDALAAFLRRRVSTARLTCSSCLALFLTAVSATERPPRRGLQRPNIQSQWLTSYTLLPRLPSALAVSALPMGKADPLCLLNLCGIVGVELPARNKGIRGTLPSTLATGAT